MRPLTLTLSLGVAFSAGMLVPLVGLHATENFRYLDYFGFIDSASAATAETVGQTAAKPTENAPLATYPGLAEEAKPAAALAVVASAPASVLPAKAAPTDAAPEAAPEPVAALTKAQIAEIQTLLVARGFDAGVIDGVLGRQTRTAIRSYEAATDMPVTGAATPALLAALSAGPAQSAPVAEPQQEVARVMDTMPAPRRAAAAPAGNGPIQLVAR